MGNQRPINVPFASFDPKGSHTTPFHCFTPKYEKGPDLLRFDFGVPYQKQFEEMFYGTDLPNGVDYREMPVNFDRYSEDDQLRIPRQMLTVIAAANRGEDLEQGPFPVTLDTLSLETALKQLEQA